MSQKNQQDNVEEMKGTMSSLGWIIFGSGCLLFALLGGKIGSLIGHQIGTGLLSGPIVWAIFYIAIGIKIVPEKEARVIERFGRYLRTIYPGINLLCLPEIIDKTRSKVSLQRQQVLLFQDAPENEMDFQDGSAVISAQVWFTVKDPGKFTYAVVNSKNWIEERFDGFIRPRLQDRTIDEALVQKNQIAQETFTESLPELDDKTLVQDINETIGVEVHRFLITDFSLSDEIKEERRKRLAGRAEAEQAMHRGRGYFDAINAMLIEAKKHDVELTFQEAREIYERQRGLETVGQTGANITFIAPDIHGVMKTIDIGPKK